MQTLAAFVQRDVRYVGIELGIGGYQPHPAAEVFAHRYGDCKDKATLLRSMLREIGVDSFHVVIYTERGAVTPKTPAHSGFNHVITAIKLPDGLNDSSLIATIQHPKLGKLLFFDPTNYLIPFGQLAGQLQANYGLLVTPDGGELIELPQQPSTMNSIRRTAQLTLDKNGTLKGNVEEVRLGQRASSERWRLRTVSKDATASNQSRSCWPPPWEVFKSLARPSSTCNRPTCLSASTIRSNLPTTPRMPVTSYWCGLA